MANATALLAAIHERIATPVMFGGGTLAVVANVGALMRTTVGRDAMLAAVGLLAPGNALVILDATKSGAKAPSQKRLFDAVTAAGGSVRSFQSPKGNGLAGWIEREARERDLQLAPGAAKELAQRVGGFVQENDATRQFQTRIASMELDKLALYRDTEPISVDDVRALVAEAVPGSIWAFVDAVGERKTGPAAGAPRAPARRDPRTGPGRRPAPAGPRAARAGRSAGRRCERSRPRRGRWASTASTGPAPSRRRPATGPPRSSPTRSTGSSSSMRWSRAHPALRRTTRSDGSAFTLWVMDHATRRERRTA